MPVVALAAALALSACSTTYGSVDSAPSSTFHAPNQNDR
jgi:hypothetical protein